MHSQSTQIVVVRRQIANGSYNMTLLNIFLGKDWDQCACILQAWYFVFNWCGLCMFFMSVQSLCTYYACLFVFFLNVLCNSKEGQLNSEWIYEDLVSPKMPTKNYQDFCPLKFIRGYCRNLGNFWLAFGRNNDLINSFWI